MVVKLTKKNIAVTSYVQKFTQYSSLKINSIMWTKLLGIISVDFDIIDQPLII